MLETIYRQLAFHKLNDAQKQEKLKKDSEYEIAVKNLYASLPREQAMAEKQKLWNAYYNWAVSQGLYEEVTPEQQLAEAESGLGVQVEQVNLIRTELKRPLLEVKEKAVEVF